ncbi:hypothetical protein ACFWAD_28325 [Rhodococcus sp. NPDC059969]|uniref:hypothetical protein n=1 Tax=Rhodococcus sp. NPDC059969 TaxID=3347018 RepID=UPI003671610E
MRIVLILKRTVLLQLWIEMIHRPSMSIFGLERAVQISGRLDTWPGMSSGRW